ncbi:FUSC family protein [Antrihabitans sp. YC2-6]|uniref:FUSC family protein n=1 Tax=Antrihabitans sp. YC2-6 TaxID=2799498 RepID=UPI0018F5E644|nr:FUSC family protein [Antrihabitans sp. YC2-6]MBJ8343717.1 FUSC family protein [Antrihabitans sp. YC2-6]
MTDDFARRYDVASARAWDALRPSGAPWAVGAGIRALAAAGIIALAGVGFGEPASIGVAYFAATMSILFAISGSHRSRLTAMAMQATGAVAGFAVAAATSNSLGPAVLVAAVMALLAGSVSAIGPAFSAFSLLLVVGTAYGQFGGSPLTLGPLVLWYLIGSAVVAVIVASESITWQPRRERAAISALLLRNAELLDVIGGADAPSARRAVGDAAGECRATLYAYRLNIRRGTVAVDAIEAAAQAARRVTIATNILYARGEAQPPGAGDILRAAAADVAAGKPISVAADDRSANLVLAALTRPARHPSVDETEAVQASRTLRSVMAVATSRTSVGSGVRLAICMAVATAAAAVLHGEHHAFWLPLTVAVVVRPELQSVFVRVVNRVAGSVVGAVLAAALLLAAPGNWVLASGAAIAMGLSALAAPKVYGLFVIGVTTSTLLSASIGEINPLAPGLRLLDTLIGCAIAVVIGYVLLPARLFAPHTPLHATTQAVAAYLRAAADPAVSAVALRKLRRAAYDSAHMFRRSLQEAALEPAALSPTARSDSPVALALEDVVDDITDLSFEVAAAGMAPPKALVDAAESAIHSVGAHRQPALDHADPASPLYRICATLAATGH